MCQVHTGAYVSLLAPGKTDYYTACHPGKTTTYILHVVPITTHTHVIYIRKSIGKNEEEKKKEIKESEEGKEKKKEKTRGSKERKEKKRQTSRPCVGND